MEVSEILKLISVLKAGAGDLISIMDDIGTLSTKMKIIAESVKVIADNMEESVRIGKNIVKKIVEISKNIPSEG